MKHIYSLFSILFAALLMAGCVNDPDIDGGIRNAKKPSVKTDEILKSTAKFSDSIGGGPARKRRSRDRGRFLLEHGIYLYCDREK